MAEPRRRLATLGALLALALLLGGCSSPTGYEPASFWTDGYGYTDRPAGPDEYTVVVRGNALTSDARAAGLALLRAAHLAREQGCERFVIVDEEARRRAQDLIRSEARSVDGLTLIVPVERRTTSEPVALLLVRLLRPDAPATDGELRVAEVIERLEAELG